MLQHNGVAPHNRELKLLDEAHFDLKNQTVLQQAVALYRFVKATCAPFGGCCIRTSGFYIPPEIAALLGPDDIWDANSDSLAAHAESYAAAVATSGVRLTICECHYMYCNWLGLPILLLSIALPWHTRTEWLTISVYLAHVACDQTTTRLL